VDQQLHLHGRLCVMEKQERRGVQELGGESCPSFHCGTHCGGVQNALPSVESSERGTSRRAYLGSEGVPFFLLFGLFGAICVRSTSFLVYIFAFYKIKVRVRILSKKISSFTCYNAKLYGCANSVFVCVRLPVLYNEQNEYALRFFFEGICTAFACQHFLLLI
jgi:hypothetical protein